MDFNDNHELDRGSAGSDRRPLTWSDSPPSGNADPILWEREIAPPAPARPTPGRGKLLVAVIATGVFLGTGFAIGAPIYALSRWWTNVPVATATSETMLTAAAPAEATPPTLDAPTSAAAARSIVMDEELLTVPPPIEAPAAPELTPSEAPPTPEPPPALSCEPPKAGPLQSRSPAAAAPIVDSTGINVPTIEGVTIDHVGIDPVAIEGFMLDPVTVERVTIDPVQRDPFQLDPVVIDPVVIDPVTIDHVTIDPVPIKHFESGPTDN
jgi:hypothetical protein